MGRLSELDAVTLDAYGTVLELDRPLQRLREALLARGVDRSEGEVERAFRAENAYYAEHKLDARDPAGLARLRAECAHVFVAEIGAELDFADAFTDALVFRAMPGVADSLARLRAHGLALAVVSNWDISLPDHLAAAAIRVDVVVTAADAGAAKPDGKPLLVALDRLRVTPERALHIGDTGDDERAAAAAGLHFAPAPLPQAVGRWLQ